MQVDFLAGEGEPCTANDGCGTGLVCRIPLGRPMMVCAKHVCSDGVDDDGDGKARLPDRPGLRSRPTTTTRPMIVRVVRTARQCSDGIDNDGDGEIDYPNDSNCIAASGKFESCVDTDPVTNIVGPTTTGTTVGLHNDTVASCGDSASDAADKSYKLHLPMKVDQLTITTTSTGTADLVTSAFNPSCGGTPLDCEDFNPIVLTNLPVGDVYFVVDGYFDAADDNGPFTIGVAGKIKNGESCEGALVTSGMLACGPTARCMGTAGMKTCVPYQCSDGIDNNGDGNIDYPNDPGCDSPTDDTETTVCPGANCPVCSDGIDNDGDGHIDYATDLSCWAASGTNESFCNGGTETDHSMVVLSATTFGNTTGLHNDETTESCQSGAGRQRCGGLVDATGSSGGRRGLGDLGYVDDELALVPIIQPGGGHEEHQKAENHIDHRCHVDDRQLVGLNAAREHRVDPPRHNGGGGLKGGDSGKATGEGIRARSDRARLLTVRVGSADRTVAPIPRRQTMRLARDQLDHLPRAVIELAHQQIDSIEEEVIKRDRDDGDRQSESRRDQGQADAVGQRFASGRPEAAAESVERLDDADDRSEQSQERSQRRHRAQDP